MTNKTSSKSYRSCGASHHNGLAESDEVGGEEARQPGTASLRMGAFTGLMEGQWPHARAKALRQEVLETFQVQKDGQSVCMVVRGEVSRACIVLGQAGHGCRMTIILIVRGATGRF